jgi:Zn-dependent M28 family amino/carboxypeptidase
MNETRAAASSLLAGQLQTDVDFLAGRLGSRNDGSARELHSLHEAANYVEKSFEQAGFEVRRQVIDAKKGTVNIEVRVPGVTSATSPVETVVIGAHYDTARGAPGADDNASGVAALLAIARQLTGRRFARSVRLVAFANEEPPHTRRPSMGSLHYAEMLRAKGAKLVAMISLEMLGYYVLTESPADYAWPMRLLPWRRGDFVMVVGNISSHRLVREAEAAFHQASAVPIKSLMLPGSLPLVKSSDHWSFWKHGCPAVMITDMGPLRNPHYHTARDTPDRLDFERFAQAVPGLCAIAERLGGVIRDCG